MLRSNKDKQTTFEFVSIERLVPQDHMLRKVDQYIDFSFIHEKVRPLYCEDNGRPAIDPLVLFKMVFLGYFYGIRSERRLEQEIQTNVAYRWFLGLGLTDRVPDHSTISWNRRKRFVDTTIFQDIFDEIVLQAIQHRMVGGRVLISDSTHVKANANKKKFTREEVLQNTKATWKNLMQPLSRSVKNKEKRTKAQRGGQRKERNKTQYNRPRQRIYGARRETGRLLLPRSPDGRS